MKGSSFMVRTARSEYILTLKSEFSPPDFLRGSRVVWNLVFGQPRGFLSRLSKDIFFLEEDTPIRISVLHNQRKSTVWNPFALIF